MVNSDKNRSISKELLKKTQLRKQVPTIKPVAWLQKKKKPTIYKFNFTHFTNYNFN